MSKSRNDGEEEDIIYSDLPDFHYDDTLKKLETSKKSLEEQVSTLQTQLQKLCEENKKLNEVNHNLSENISSLYKTANNELKRKDRLIQELRDENNRLIFRKKRFNSKPEYSAVNKDIASEERNHVSVNLDASVSSNKCSYKEDVGSEICKEMLVISPNVPPISIPPNAEETNKIILFQTNTSNCLKLSDGDVKSSESFPSSNEHELNSESNLLIRLKKIAENQSESPEIFSRLEKSSPKPEYLEKHMAHRIKEMSSKYSYRNSSVKMANTVKSKYSKSRSRRSVTPFDKNDYRNSKFSRGRSPHRRNSDRQPDISFMRSISRYSRSRSPPRRNKNYDSYTRYHLHSKERKYNFKVHEGALDKFDSKNEYSSKKISCSSKSKQRETSKNSVPVHSRYEDKNSISSHSSKPNSSLKHDYELHKSSIDTFLVHTNDVPAEPKNSQENYKKSGDEPKLIKSNVLDHLPRVQKDLKHSELTESRTIEVNDLFQTVNTSACSGSVVNLDQKVNEPTCIASDHSPNVALDKINSCMKYEDIVKMNVSSRNNLESREIKCHKETSDENKSNFQSPVKNGEHNIKLQKTSPTFQDPAIFKGGSVSICMFNEQADFTRKRKRTKLVITNKSLSNLSVNSKFASKVTTDSKSINSSNTLEQDLKQSSVNSSPDLKKFKFSSEIESLHSTKSNCEHQNALNSIENETINISHNTDAQISQISSNKPVYMLNNPKILPVKEFSCDNSIKNNELNCEKSEMVLAANDNILINENAIAKDGEIEKKIIPGVGETLIDEKICSLSKICVSNKENILSNVASNDKSTKLSIVKDNSRKEFFNDSLEEGEIIDENSLDESDVRISNMDEIPPTKVEKIQERTNQRRSSGNSRRTNSTTRQTTRVKNAFGNSICERRSPSELFTGDKSRRKINTKGDSHPKTIRSDDDIVGNRTNEKRIDAKLKHVKSKRENKNIQKGNHSHHLKISEIDVEKQTDENVSTMEQIQNADKDCTDSVDIKIDYKKSCPREKLKERNQKTLKQLPSRILLNTSGLNSTESKENACQSKEKRKIKTNKLCDMNHEKLSTTASDSESLSNKSISSSNLISAETINNTVHVETTLQETAEKQEITVSNDKYSSSAKINDKVETNRNTGQNFCSDVSQKMHSSDADSNKTKSDIHVLNNKSDNCGASGTSDTGLARKEMNDAPFKVYKRKNARMTRSKINTPSTKGKSNNDSFEKLVKGISDSENLKPVKCKSNYATVLQKEMETTTFADCLKREMNENPKINLNTNSHSTSAKTLSENDKQTHCEMASPYKESKIHQVGVEKPVTDTNQHKDVKCQSIESSDLLTNENCDVNFTSNIVTSQNKVLHASEQDDTRELREVEIKSPLISSLNTVCNNNEQINSTKNKIMSNEELIQILVGSPPSAQKTSVNSSDKNILANRTDVTMQQKINMKTPELSQQSMKMKTIIMHRRSRVRMFQDSPIQTFTISSKFGHKVISNTSTSTTDKTNELIKECDVKPPNKLEDPCVQPQVAVSKSTIQEVHDRENIVNSDSKNKSSFTKLTTKNSAVEFSDVFGTNNGDDSYSDKSDDSMYIPNKAWHPERGHTKKKKKVIKVKLKTLM